MVNKSGTGTNSLDIGGSEPGAEPYRTKNVESYHFDEFIFGEDMMSRDSPTKNRTIHSTNSNAATNDIPSHRDRAPPKAFKKLKISGNSIISCRKMKILENSGILGGCL